MKQWIYDLTNLTGISSREDQVIEYMLQAFQQYSAELDIDRLGNVICHFPAKEPNAPKAMVFGHMDEIGLIVRQIDTDGFLRVERVGGVHTQILPGTRVEIMGSAGVVTGMIGTKSHHFMKPTEKYTVPIVEDLYVDIGAMSANSAQQMGVEVGHFLTFQPNFTELTDHLVSNKAMDNRIACAALLELAKQLDQRKEPLAWDIYLVACVQEEVNIRGILPAVRRIKPDISIGIDVTPACDTPDLKGYTSIELGKGPAFTFYNFHGRGTLAGVLPDERLLRRLIQTATDHNIPHQREVAMGVITENAYILFEEFGIPVASLSVPTRYTHTPIETVHIQDVERTVDILYHFIDLLDINDRFGKQFLLDKEVRKK